MKTLLNNAFKLWSGKLVFTSSLKGVFYTLSIKKHKFFRMTLTKIQCIKISSLNTNKLYYSLLLSTSKKQKVAYVRKEKNIVNHNECFIKNRTHHRLAERNTNKWLQYIQCNLPQKLNKWNLNVLNGLPFVYDVRWAISVISGKALSVILFHFTASPFRHRNVESIC